MGTRDIYEMRTAWNKGLKTGIVPITAFKKGHIPWSKGISIPYNVRLKISIKLKGRKLPEETRIKMSVLQKGRKFTEEHKNKISETRKRLIKIGVIPNNGFKIGHCSGTTGKKFTQEHKDKISLSQKGDKSRFWRGGHKYYRLHDYNWTKIRKEIYKRDNWTCKECSCKDRKLHCHHIIPYRISKDDSFDNLVTLCNKCHAKKDFELLRKENYELSKSN